MPTRNWRLNARREHGVLLVHAQGVATVESLNLLRGFVRAALAPDDRAAVVDLRSVSVSLEERDWEQIAKDSAAFGDLCRPVALVVMERNFDRTARYCLTAAQHGVARMAFSDLKRAVSWARTVADGAPSHPPTPSPAGPPGRLRLVHSRC